MQRLIGPSLVAALIALAAPPPPRRNASPHRRLKPWPAIAPARFQIT